MFSFIEKKNRIKELDRDGFYIGKIHNQDGLKRFFICLLRGFMVFLACYGTVAGVVEAFHIPYNQPFVMVFLLLFSLFTACLYYHKIIFYIGYVVLMFVFTYALGVLYYYANSGFQAIVNIIYEDYSDYFKLLSLREAQEFITDRYTTVTIAMIFIGILLAILLNVTISGYMNLLETILITFPFLEIAFYIEQRPPLYCIIMLLTAYIFVGIQQAGKYYKMPVKGRNTPEYLRIRRKNKRSYLYQSNAKGTLQTILFSAALAILLGTGFYTSYYSIAPVQSPNKIKETTDEYVKIFIQSGFTGLFDRYSSVGGLSHGKLGGVSSIRPDFETDLTVTFAPYSYETVYLKGFTGSYYSSNQWSEHASYDLTSVYMHANDIASYDALYMPETDCSAKMEIINVDADSSYQYQPYYSSKDDITKESESAVEIVNDGTGESNAVITSVMYAPYLGKYNEDVKPYDLPEDYEKYIYEFCLQIPDELRPTLHEYCAKAGFPGIATGSFDTAPPSNPEEINAYRLEVAQSIYKHFWDEFDYTMSPGTTPYRRDFVEYFLTTQKRGVCAHFAASGTMLLRSMGIPARYVEGYCIPLSVMEDGKAIAAEYSEWYQGENLIGEEGILSVDVTDAQAHAWIEIYLEGYGFIPFEMTPPDFAQEAETNFNFGNLFGNLLSFQVPDTNIISGNENMDYERDELQLFSLSFRASFTPFLTMLGIVIGACILILIIRILYRKYTYSKLLKEGNYAELVYLNYEMLLKQLRKKKEMNNPNPLPDEFGQALKDVLSETEAGEQCTKEIDSMMHLFEKALYAPDKMNSDEYLKFMELYHSLRKSLSKVK